MKFIIKQAYPYTRNLQVLTTLEQFKNVKRAYLGKNYYKNRKYIRCTRDEIIEKCEPYFNNPGRKFTQEELRDLIDNHADFIVKCDILMTWLHFVTTNTD